MKFKFDIVFQAIGDFYLAVPVGERSKDCMNYIKINGSCYFIASCIESGMDVGQIVEGYMQEYDIERVIAERDVMYTIQSLREMGFLED